MSEKTIKKTPLDWALEYYQRGWNVIPNGFDKKPPKGFKWTPYQTDKVTVKNLEEWFGEKKYRNMAVIVGKVSGGLTIIDFDRPDLYDRWKADHPDLAKTLPTVQTSRGFHVYCCSDLDKSESFDKIDLLAAKKYALLPPSKHPDGEYKWTIPLNGALHRCDPLDWGLDRYTEETEETEEIEAISTNRVVVTSPFARLEDRVAWAIAATLPTKEKQRNKKIFKFCRYLKSFPEYASNPPSALQEVFKQWHEKALPFIQTESFSVSWADFLYGWPRVKLTVGETTLMKAVQMASENTNPLPEAEHYDSEDIKFLLRICFELHKLTTPVPFWISVRDAAGITRKTARTCSRWLEMFVSEGILEVVKKHTAKEATRYRWLGSGQREVKE